jgi:hypothetical protein
VAICRKLLASQENYDLNKFFFFEEDLNNKLLSKVSIIGGKNANITLGAMQPLQVEVFIFKNKKI